MANDIHDGVDYQQGPVLAAALFHSTENVACLFAEDDDRLPTFLGQSYPEHTAAWRALDRKVKWAFWRKAAIAAALERMPGQRSGPTPIQRFCSELHIGPVYVSRLARTYRVFDQAPLSPGIKTLLDDPRISFKHFMIAANAAVIPKVALMEARDLGWSANEFARVLAARKNRTLIDADTGAPILHADDDDDPAETNWRNLPERAVPVGRPKTREWKFLLTAKEHAVLARRVKALSAVLGTSSDLETVLAIVRRAHSEWVEGRTAGPRANAARGGVEVRE
jgi:hypothetical protein